MSLTATFATQWLMTLTRVRAHAEKHFQGEGLHCSPCMAHQRKKVQPASGIAGGSSGCMSGSCCEGMCDTPTPQRLRKGIEVALKTGSACMGSMLRYDPAWRKKTQSLPGVCM